MSDKSTSVFCADVDDTVVPFFTTARYAARLVHLAYLYVDIRVDRQVITTELSYPRNSIVTDSGVQLNNTCYRIMI